MLVILLNCVTLGMYRPCVDDQCVETRCKILQVFDDFIFAFFALEMSVKMIAMGVYGKGTYLADSWNRLDFFIVLAGAFEYCLFVENINLSAIRTIRVLRPLRAINRIPSMRILVMLLLDTLPMLGNVLLLCFFVFFIFGIVGVQLWEGTLRQRCFIIKHPNISYRKPLAPYYKYIEQERDYICSKPEDNGMHLCSDLPPYREGDMICNGSALPFHNNLPTANSCVNWNQYYTECTASSENPFQGTISFDNIGLAWVAIFLVISLEGWTDIMYYTQDAHSFWDWIYFVLLIVIGSFFMINLCLVVIATQFAETKKREMERMRLERERFRSTSTLASSTNNSEPTSCYAEMVKYVAHLYRRGKRRMLKKWRLYKYRRQQQQEQKLLEAGGGVGVTAPGPGIITLQQYHHNNDGNHGHNHSHNHHNHHQARHHHHHHHHRHGCPAIGEPARPSEIPTVQSLTPATLFQDGEVGSPAPRATPEIMDVDPLATPRRPGLLRVPSISNSWDPNTEGTQTGPHLLSPPSLTPPRRRSSVMFSDVVFLHGGNTTPSVESTTGKNVCSSEKMTQTGDGNVWEEPTQVPAPGECGGMVGTEAMTCQELLALSGALSAALPTGQLALDSFFSSLSKGGVGDEPPWNPEPGDGSADWATIETGVSTMTKRRRPRGITWSGMAACCSKCFGLTRRCVKTLVEHKYFQQGILLAILINTLSMGIEYHNQPDELTVIVEISNIVFSAIFAVEMLLKVTAEGPFGYVSNGFNVFDGIIVILSVIEMCQTYLGDGEGSSGLSVLRTFRLLRILKLVRFMPNLRRQLFVMLRTMDNVAVFFSLLILFIFIFSTQFLFSRCLAIKQRHGCCNVYPVVVVCCSILGMYLFGGKFCMIADNSRECTCDEIVHKHPLCVCDRKHFNNILWATVTVFQILTQEDWNVVLFNGMEKTSHWAALYFVALMTFGNYVLFNLLVAILVEGFSAERNERKEREERELAKHRRHRQQRHHSEYSENYSSFDGSRSSSSSGSGSCTHELRNKWRSAEEIRKAKDNGHREKENSWKLKQQLDGDYEPKCNIQKESKMMCQPPIITTTAATPQDSPNTTLDSGIRDFHNRLSPASALYSSSMSIDSIDRSTSSQCSIPGLLKPPTPNIRNNLGQSPASQPLGRRVSLVTTINQSAARKDSSPSTPRIQRGYSWKLGRPSLRRISRCNSGSEADDPDQETGIVLNNGLNNNNNNNNHILSPIGYGDHSHCNGGLLGTIRNDTQGTPNNNRRYSNNRELSRQNSIRSHDSTPSYCAIPQVAWVDSLARQTSLSSGNFTPHPFHKALSPRNSLCSYRSSVYNTAGSGRRKASLQQFTSSFDEETKQINNLIARAAAEASPLPRIKQAIAEDAVTTIESVVITPPEEVQPEIPKKIFFFFEPTGVFKEKEDFSLYLFPEDSKFRQLCCQFVEQRWFDNVVLLFIGLNCITLAMERPNIPPDSTERVFLAMANNVFTGVFALEMFVKVIAAGMFYGKEAYFTSGWNIMDGSLVIISIIDLLMSLLSESSPRIFGILRVFRLLRSLRPLRVINRAPGLKLVVQTLLSSLRPIGNIVLICCTFFIIFGILGVQLFKGAFFFCEGPSIKNVRNKTDCLADRRNNWINRKYNFDDLGKALMSLFVLSSRDGWVNIMYTGLDAVGVDQQPIENYSEWRLLYFIAFILLVGFFVLNMFVGVVVENFHRCREEQEKEERVRRLAKRAKQMEKKRRKMHEPPYYTNYSHSRLMVHNVVTSKYFDLAIAAVIGLNVVTMAMEFYHMPKALEYALRIFNYFFTAVFIVESIMKLVALGFKLYFKDRWNQLDIMIVFLSIIGIVLEELESKIIPINPTIIRVMRVLRIARVLKLLKMAKGIRALLDTVMQALPQVGNLGLLFFLLFFIFAALGVELFGRLECSELFPCQGLGEHAHFSNFGMAFLTLFRVATGDNWNGIMKDTLREDCDDAADCVRNCCVSTVIAPIFFVIFVLMAQFVLVNVVVAVLMKHLEESHKQMEDELDMEVELERELAAENEELMEEEEELCLQQALEMALEYDNKTHPKKPLSKVLSLPANFTFHGLSDTPDRDAETIETPLGDPRRGSADFHQRSGSKHSRQGRRQTFHSHQGLLLAPQIPPAYPASEYTPIHKAEEERVRSRRQSLRRQSNTERHSDCLLAVPQLKASDVGSSKGLNLAGLFANMKMNTSCQDLWRNRGEGEVIPIPSPVSPNEDISPECLSPSATLVPPTYGAATRQTLKYPGMKSTETSPISEEGSLENPTSPSNEATTEEDKMQLIIPEKYIISIPPERPNTLSPISVLNVPEIQVECEKPLPSPTSNRHENVLKDDSSRTVDLPNIDVVDIAFKPETITLSSPQQSEINKTTTDRNVIELKQFNLSPSCSKNELVLDNTDIILRIDDDTSVSSDSINQVECKSEQVCDDLAATKGRATLASHLSEDISEGETELLLPNAK